MVPRPAQALTRIGQNDRRVPPVGPAAASSRVTPTGRGLPWYIETIRVAAGTGPPRYPARTAKQRQNEKDLVKGPKTLSGNPGALQNGDFGLSEAEAG
ncbi:hypothetical protein NL676_007119 [Syzygium grande]|nr:hypothetical protein NL676_007119 [Syzygium grande]